MEASRLRRKQRHSGSPPFARATGRRIGNGGNGRGSILVDAREMGDLEEAITYALEPMTQREMVMLCSYCGIMYQARESHTCPTVAVDLLGRESPERKRALSYAI